MKAVIVNPSRILGGTEFVYLLLAEQLIERGERVTIVDFDNGWTSNASIASRIQAAAITIIAPTCRNWGLKEADVVLCSAKFVALAVRQGKAEGADVSTRLLAWLVHPLELYSNNFRTLKRLTGLLKLAPGAGARTGIWLSNFTGHTNRLRKLIMADRLHAMDETTSLSITAHFPDLTPSIFPVPGSVGDEATSDERPPVYGIRPLSIVWISRLEGFKLPPLIKLLGDLGAMPPLAARGVKVTIIGEGEGLTQLQQISRTLPSFVETEFKGFMQASQLRRFLTTQSIDLAVGMGTALSLCAAHGIASVIATAADDIAEYERDGPAFRFLGSRASYSLGEYQNDKPVCFRYFGLQRILARATAFPAIGRAQKKWYQTTYGEALPAYLAKMYELVSYDNPVAKSSRASAVFARLVQHLLLKRLYKNAAFPP